MAEITAYTLDEVASMLKLTKRSLYNYIRNGKLQAVKMGKYWRVTAESLQQLLENERADSSTVTGQLTLNGSHRFQVDKLELENGDRLQVLLIGARDSRPTWTDTRADYSGDTPQLEGLPGYTYTGLFARVKK